MDDGDPYGRRLTELAARRGDEVALVFAASDGTERELSWAALESAANRTARVLAARGVGDGDIVVLALPNTPTHVVTTFAIWKLGASMLPMRADLPAWERDRVLGLVDAALVVADAWDDLPGVLHGGEIARLVDDPALDDTPLPGEHVPPYERLIPSGGSTGSPKIIATPRPGCCPESAADLAPSSAVHLAVSPFYHANGFSACYPPLLSGARVVLMGRFDAARLLDLVARHRVTHVMVVPTMLLRVARLPDVGEHDLSSIEELVFGGAALPEWVARVWLDLVPPERFHMVYGGTEQHGLVTCTGREWLERPGTTGRPSGCDLLVLDADHEPAAPGEVGEIWFRRHDPRPTFRYLGRAEPEPLHGELHGFGDLGWVDEEGYLYIADRRQDMIVSGGVNVYPAEVEAALSEHPDLVDAAVIGLPDPEWGHRVHAVVVPHAGVTVDGDAVRAWCRARMSGVKVPKTVEVAVGLPRNDAGKLNRSQLIADRVAVVGRAS